MPAPDRRVFKPSQSNEVLKILQTCKLDPAQFDWLTPEQTTERWRQRDTTFVRQALRHRTSGFFCSFGWPNNELVLRFSPGINAPNERGLPGDWEMGRQYIYEWAQRVKVELEQPDMWEAAKAAHNLFEPTEAIKDGDQPLSKPEIALLRTALNELQATTKSQFAVTTEQLDQLRLVCNEIVESSKRVSRKDLKLIILGLFMSWLLPLSFTRDEAFAWLGLAASSVAGFFRHLLT